MGHIFLGEFLGTATLVLLGNGVVANSIFKKTKGANAGGVLIAFGGGLAVFAGVAIASIFTSSGNYTLTGDINPAVATGQGVGGKIDITHWLVYVGSELLGGLFGQILVVTFYGQHIKKEEQSTVLAMHSTGPTHEKSYFTNIFSEVIATMVLVAMAYYAIDKGGFLGAPLAIALTVVAIGMSLGGTTGYAINPARDLSPRIIHSLIYRFTTLKKANPTVNSGWKYGGIPVVAPLTAGALIGLFYRVM